jgi:hypothetical protein
MSPRASPWYFGCALLACRASTGLEGLPIQVVSGAEQVVPPGVVARTEHYDMQVSAPAECEPSGASAGTRRVGVLVTVQARGTVQVPANPYYARLRDGQNVVREPTLSGCTPALASALLETPGVARGWINFEVPRGATDFLLAYAPLLTTGERPEVTFRLAP